MDFQKTYPNRDKLDCVIMTLLTYTFDLKKQLPVNSQEEIDLKTEKIIQTLSELEIDWTVDGKQKKRYKIVLFFSAHEKLLLEHSGYLTSYPPFFT